MNTHALRDGFGRAIRSKRYLLLIFVANFAIAAAMSYGVARSIEKSLGSSASAETMVESFDPMWFDGFEVEADGLAATFDPRITGVGAVLDALERFLNGEVFSGNSAILGAALLYVLLWSFLTGGLLWRFQLLRGRGSFFGNCGRYFPRLLVLGLLGGFGYFATLYWGLPELRALLEEPMRELVDERRYALYTLAEFGAVLVTFALIDLLMTYSKIITVVRDVRPLLVIFTPFRALWFVICHPLRTLGITLFLAWVLALLSAAYGVFGYFYPNILNVVGLTPGSYGGIAILFGAGQLYILGRIFLKLFYLSSHTTLFEAIRVLPPMEPVEDAAAEPGEEESLATAAGVGGASGGASMTPV